MSDLRIDYSAISGVIEEAKKRGKGSGPDLRALPRRAGRVLLLATLIAVLPFAILIRGGVFAYAAWGLGAWSSLFVAMLATALLLGAYAWVVSVRLGASAGTRKLLTRGAAAVAGAYVVYALVFVASANVKSDAVRAGYSEVHPLLRVASSAVILVDPASVITDAGRTLEDYRLMGLTPNEASLHFEQDTGFVHAIDLRTVGRPEWRNRAVELGFWAMGFHSLRHVGTADHLHVSLRLP